MLRAICQGHLSEETNLGKLLDQLEEEKAEVVPASFGQSANKAAQSGFSVPLVRLFTPANPRFSQSVPLAYLRSCLSSKARDTGAP